MRVGNPSGQDQKTIRASEGEILFAQLIDRQGYYYMFMFGSVVRRLRSLPDETVLLIMRRKAWSNMTICQYCAGFRALWGISKRKKRGRSVSFAEKGPIENCLPNRELLISNSLHPFIPFHNSPLL